MVILTALDKSQQRQQGGHTMFMAFRKYKEASWIQQNNNITSVVMMKIGCKKSGTQNGERPQNCCKMKIKILMEKTKNPINMLSMIKQRHQRNERRIFL